jgi:adenine/guanine/hypoxanthine permease
VATITPDPTHPERPETTDRVDRWFELSARSSSYRAELIGGATTFLTLVYIVFVNPSILSGTADLAGTKLQFDQVLAVTALAGGILTILMGVFGRYPFALASGLGLNAFAAAEVAAHRVTWGSMMGIFVIDGAVIVVLVVLGLRERIIDAIPYDLKLAIGIGIGAFITVVGLKNAGLSSPAVSSAPSATCTRGRCSCSSSVSWSPGRCTTAGSRGRC